MANAIGGVSPHDITATKAYVDRKTGAKADKLRFHEAKGSNVPGMNVVVVEPQIGAANHANVSLVSDASIVLSYDGPTSAKQGGGSAAEFELPAAGEASGSFVFNDMVSIGTDVTFSADVDVSRRVDGSIAMTYVRIYITVNGNRHLVHEWDFYGEPVSNDFYYGEEVNPSSSTFDGIFVSSIFSAFSTPVSSVICRHSPSNLLFSTSVRLRSMFRIRQS